MKTLRSHYVSQLLLRRFAKKGKVNVWSLANKSFTLQIPYEVAYLDLPLEVFHEVEKDWSQKYEGKVGEAYIHLEKGDLLDHKKHLDLLIGLMSLLFVRSLAMYAVMSKYSAEALDKLKNEFMPLGVSEPDIEKMWNDKLYWKAPQTINDLIKKVKTFLLQYKLEICVSSHRDKLILSDNPVVNMHKDGRVGVISGVALLDSDAIILPLTPNHVVAISSMSKNMYTMLDKKSVKKINNLSKITSQREWYCLPQ